MNSAPGPAPSLPRGTNSPWPWRLVFRRRRGAVTASGVRAASTAPAALSGGDGERAPRCLVAVEVFPMAFEMGIQMVISW